MHIHICGSILSLVQIFSIVQNSLSYITIPKKQREIKFEPRFSNSLIIHGLMTQSACINLVRCIYVDTQ